MQKLLNIPLQFLKSILSAFWEIFKIGFWLLIQAIELSAWALAILAKKIERTKRMVRIALKRKKMGVIWEPFKLLWGGVWTCVVIGFWLTIQIIELFVWVLARLRSLFTQTTPASPAQLENIPLPPSVKMRQKMAEMRSPSTSADAENAPLAASSPPIAKLSGQSHRRLESFWQKLPVLILLSLLLPSLFILGKSLLPTVREFEGNLIVEEMSFTYAGNDANKVFINAIRGIQRLEIEGRQKVTFTGKFQSQSNSRLNQLKNLEIQLPNLSSKLIVEPANPQQSQLELVELLLQPTAKVDRLRYNPVEQQLALSLQTGESKRANSLKLSLGDRPIKVTLTDYQLAGRDRQDFSRQNPLEFTLTPTVTKVHLSLKELTNLSTRLSEPQPKISEKWFPGNLEVENIKFEKTIQTANGNDNLTDSTIVEGKISMAQQNLAIASKQFLLPGKPGIDKLRYLQINFDKPQGLKVGIRGEADAVEVGLAPDVPVNSIPANILRYLSRDAIIALLIVSTVVTGALLSWLVVKLIQKS